MSEDETRRNPMAKALEIAADIATGDEYGVSKGDDDLTPRDFGELRVKQWGKFARKHDLPYREHMSPPEIAADPSLVAMFTELRDLRYPLSLISGLMEGSWHGCEFVGFHTCDATEDGKFQPFRFVCSRLSRPYPDLVHDRSLSGTSQTRGDWYPGFDGYEVVDGPRPPAKERKRGLLARTPVGQAFSAVADGLFGPYKPKLHTASPEFAASVVARASRPYDERPFKYNWAVRGSWLVLYCYDGQSGLINHGQRAEFLDVLPLVSRLIE